MLISILKNQFKTRPLLLGFLCMAAVATIAIGTLTFTAKANAFSPNYNWNDLIDNPTFIDTTAMNTGDIQTFLNNVGSGLAGLSDVEACDSTIAPYYTHFCQTISNSH